MTHRDTDSRDTVDRSPADTTIGRTPDARNDASLGSTVERSGDKAQGAGVMGTMLLPAIILVIIGIAVILYFAL